MGSDYQIAREVAARVVAEHGRPRFYREKAAEVERSRELFDTDPEVQRCRALVEEMQGGFGHGLQHSYKVAIDAGAILLVEAGTAGPLERRMVALAHLAGLLHDIRRKKKNHAREGAQEARRLLEDFALEDRWSDAICLAIANHEAFQEQLPTDDVRAQSLSDALYDADKFRWGPDNFAETLWDMVEPFNIPIPVLLKGFQRGMDVIERIRTSFRSRTGQEYGPDFIDMGMNIGLEIYKELLVEFS